MKHPKSVADSVVRCMLLILAAFGLFAFLFLRAGDFFWLWLTLSVVALCAAAILAEPGAMRDALAWGGRRTGMKTLVLGILSAAVLYGVFFIGNLAVRRLFPFAAGDIEAVYGQGAGAPRWIVGLLLLAIVGPGEEIFWRGYVQRRLTAEFENAGFMVSILAYTGVHLATGNLTLILAAFVCGAFWALLYRLFGSIWSNVVSHALWTAAIFVWWPMR